LHKTSDKPGLTFQHLILPLVIFSDLPVTIKSVLRYTKTFVINHKLKFLIMKKLLLPSLAGLLFAGTMHAQENNNNKETIEGNGKLVTRNINVSSFDALKAVVYMN
jgi:hypothetical protein